MLVYRFKPSGRVGRRVALSIDRSGRNLPSDGVPWEPIGQLDLATTTPWVNAPVREIEETLAEVGYFIWSISTPVLKSRFQK